MLNNKDLNSYKDARKSLMCIVISSGESSWMKWLPTTVTSIKEIGTIKNKCVRINDHSNINFMPEFLKGKIPVKDDT